MLRMAGGGGAASTHGDVVANLVRCLLTASPASNPTRFLADRLPGLLDDWYSAAANAPRDSAVDSTCGI